MRIFNNSLFSLRLRHRMGETNTSRHGGGRGRGSSSWHGDGIPDRGASGEVWTLATVTRQTIAAIHLFSFDMARGVGLTRISPVLHRFFFRSLHRFKHQDYNNIGSDTLPSSIGVHASSLHPDPTHTSSASSRVGVASACCCCCHCCC